MVDQLAQEYDGQPVVFLEYDVDEGFYSRSSRWWAAFSGGQAILPLVMVDSGNHISNGYVDFYNVYKAMVDASLIRLPQAEIEAYAWRNGNKVAFYVQVKNLTDVTLSSSSNSATVHGIVYEDIHVGVTDRYVRSAISTNIPSLAPNNTATFILGTSDLDGVNWENLHYIVLVDYIPPESLGAYDMLEAVRADSIPLPFDVQPNPLSFFIDPEDPPNPSGLLNIHGANFLYWSAIENTPWLTISPTNGSIETPPIVTIDTAMLSPGVQQGVITFTTDDSYFTQDVTVRAYYGPVKHAYLPLINR